MKLSSFLRLSLFFLIITACGSDDTTEPTTTPTTPGETSPNILLVIADDMGLDATPGYSESTEKPSMPNLEALMASGVKFQNFWAAPVCTPTRATILTGKYGNATGVLGVDDPISLSETSVQRQLDNDNSGYSHAVIGKWHLSTDPNHPTDMGVGYYAGLLSGAAPSYTSWRLTENGNTATTTEYATSKFTDLAIDWVSAQTTPWFLWLAYNAPHTPFHAPPTNLHSQGALSTDQATIDANPLPYYLAAMEAMDTEMGRLLGSLSEEERANTIVIFIGDNGTPGQVVQSPYARRKSKGSLYQGGINVPLVVSGTGVTRMGATETALINSTDLFATVTDLAGTGTSEWQDSKSIVGLFSSSNPGFRETTYAEVNSGGTVGYAIRNTDYKLIVFEDGTEEFYNLSSDPYENSNLLNGTLSTAETAVLNTLQTAAQEIRN